MVKKELPMGTQNNMGKCKNYIESNKPDIKHYIQYDFMYMNRQN